MTAEEIGDEAAQADAWLTWSANPCGKPALRLAELERQAAPLSEEVFVLGVDFAKRPGNNSDDRRAALTNLEGAVHAKPECPPLFGYYEGEREGWWVIEVYGRGAPWKKLPAPPQPAWMQ